MQRKSITLSDATRIILAAYGPGYQLDQEGASKWTQCRLVRYRFNGVTIFRTDVKYEAADWYDLLCKAVPFFKEEFNRDGKTTLSEYCGRLIERRKIAENVDRNTG